MAFTTMERFRDDQGHEVMLRWNWNDSCLLLDLEVVDEQTPDEVRVLHPIRDSATPSRPSVDAETPLPLEMQ